MLTVSQQIVTIPPGESGVKSALKTWPRSKRSRLQYLSSCLGRWRTTLCRHCHSSTEIFHHTLRILSHSYLSTTLPNTTGPQGHFRLYRTPLLRVGISDIGSLPTRACGRSNTQCWMRRPSYYGHFSTGSTVTGVPRGFGPTIQIANGTLLDPSDAV